MDDAHTAWYEREAQYIEQALETARVYQYKCPEISDYTEDFLDQLDHRYQEKDDFIKSYRYRHGDLEIDTSGYRDDVQQADSIEDLFCDHCEEFQFSVGVKGDAHYCSTCWDDLCMADQSGLTDYDTAMTGSTEPDRHYAVVGCGDDKANEAVPARELYTSTYFEKKRDYAEEVCDGWAILSAKHGIVDPNEELAPYDVTAEDVDPDDYVERVADEIAEYAGREWEPDGTVWILVGQPYLSLEDESGRAIRDVVSEELEQETRFPFRQTSGIGKQMGWLNSCVEQGRAAMPYNMDDPGQQTIDQY